MKHVTSADGTAIAYSRAGEGPVVVVVGGGLDDGSENAPLAAALAETFCVVNYTRRGRGSSGDTLPYAVEREVEDLAAVIGDDGPVDLLGVSSGGTLALLAVAAGLPVRRVAVYEVPCFTDAASLAAWDEYVTALRAALADDRREEALALFMRLAGSSDDDIASAKASSYWPALEALAHTLAYDEAVMGDGRPPGAVDVPVLVATGGRDPFFEAAADALAAALPRGERRVFADSGHVLDPAVALRELTAYFGRGGYG